jgi:membrane-associated phospholipid phosphatase
MSHRAATILSVVGHPFVLIPLMVAVTAGSARLAAGIAAVTVLGMLAEIVRRVRSGRWSDHDVSRAEERHSFYPMAIGSVGAGAVAAWLLGVNVGVVRGFVAGVCLLIVGAVLTRWTKVSLHTMFGAFCVVVVVTAGVGLALGFATLVAGVGWSRVVLGRHTVAQVAIGALVGATGGLLLVVLNALAS